ncbi:hypothetical protein [Yoonia sp.]|uniref:hypothetical protein n=1 Tax=Yoonia sp. TaxID=2212373 RepID=UPI0025EBA525|nr:hypothetical protein [Yoonia sp.]
MSAGEAWFGEVSRRKMARRILNPRHPQTPLHLRRICGVCAHFDGTLRKGGQVDCLKLKIKVRAPHGAADCAQWVRK